MWLEGRWEHRQFRQLVGRKKFGNLVLKHTISNGKGNRMFVCGVWEAGVAMSND